MLIWFAGGSEEFPAGDAHGDGERGVRGARGQRGRALARGRGGQSRQAAAAGARRAAGRGLGRCGSPLGLAQAHASVID
jgi:hypothetical protein